MEGAPKEIDQMALLTRLKEIGEDVSVHAFHIWSISQGAVAISFHIHCRGKPMMVLKEATRICQEEFKIGHVTIQTEDLNDEENMLDCSDQTNNSDALISTES